MNKLFEANASKRSRAEEIQKYYSKDRLKCCELKKQVVQELKRNRLTFFMVKEDLERGQSCKKCCKKIWPQIHFGTPSLVGYVYAAK